MNQPFACRLLICVLAFSASAALWRTTGIYAQSAQYILTDIGVLPGRADSFTTAISNSGVVAGGSGSRAVVYKDGTLQDLGTLDAGPFSRSQANGINESHIVVGEATGTGGRLRAFIYENGAMTAIGPSDAAASRARAVNSRTQIVGEWVPPDFGPARAFLYENGVFTDLGALAEGEHAQANAINSHGQIVGFSSQPTWEGAPPRPPGHAVMWENGTIVDLGTFNGFGTSPWAISDSGLIAGAYGPVVDGRQTTRAFIYDLRTRVYSELPVPAGASSFGLGINTAGDVVGYMIPAGTSAVRAVLWRGGVLYDLNDLIPPGSGWTLNQARDINDAGQIAATGRHDGQLRGVVLTPSEGPGWASQDVGNTGLAGSAEMGSDGIFTVRGAGHDIWDTSDAFHFVHQPLTGDGTITARVVSLTDTNPYAKAGVMLRDGVSPAAAHVILNIKPGGGVEFMKRGSEDGPTMFLAGGMAPAPYWLRLTRSGAMVTGSISPDGLSWTEVGSTTVSMPETLEAGLAVTSHDPEQLNTARFAGVSLVRAPWMNQDVGETGLTGSAVMRGDGMVNVRGAGSNIWGTADSFHYLYRTLPAEGRITARVLGMQHTHTKAKAGVMIRESLAPDAAHVILNVKPDGDVEFMQRATTGGSTAYLGGGTGSWIRLERNGTNITASVSNDGSTWTLIGSTTMNDSGEVFIGAAVTSHDPARLNSAVFDRLVVHDRLVFPF